MNGYTPLIYAASHNQLRTLEYLLSQNADPNLASNKGETPLHFASANGFDRAVQILLRAGSDVNQKCQVRRLFQKNSLTKQLTLLMCCLLASVQRLIYCDLVYPYGMIQLGQYSFRYWLIIAWWHQAISWTSFDKLSMRSCGIHMRAMQQEMMITAAAPRG